MARRHANTGQPSTRITRKDLKPKKPPTDRELIRQAARAARDHEWRTNQRGLSADEVQLRADVEAQRAARRARRNAS